MIFGYNPVKKSVSLILSFGVENSGSKDGFLNHWGSQFEEHLGHYVQGQSHLRVMTSHAIRSASLNYGLDWRI